MIRQTMRTWAEISLGNLEHNYRALRACAPNSGFLGVVKANAYGHGAVPVAKRLEELGADYLAVACLDEGAELRRAGLELPILILGHTPPEQAPEVVELGLTQTVFTPELAGALSRAAGAVGTRAKVHLKLDTGMSRLGILAHDPERAAQVQAAYEESVQWVLDHPTEAAALAEEYLDMNAAVVEAAIPNMGLTFKSAQDAKEELDTFYNLLYNFEPSMIGGELPDEGLFYAG